MSKPILVTFATRYGSTEEVAEFVATTLREHGQSVDLVPAHKVNTVEAYRAVILGAPLYIGKLHQHAHDFIMRHQIGITERPLVIFALGPISTDEAEMRGSQQQLQKDLEQYAWLDPVTVETFVGKYDPAKLNFVHKLIAILPASPLNGRPVSDNRDWNAIRQWARGLSEQLEV